MSALPVTVDTIHPSLWRASQLARAPGRTVDTGYARLSAELPGAGWPQGALIELLTQQAGVGELRLVAPALSALRNRHLTLIAPPHRPNAPGLAHIGVPIDRVILLQPKSTADALWSAEQILKAGSCGALLLWQQHVRTESLRRLQVAAKSGETLFFLVRPIAAAADPSPAELRLTLRPAAPGVKVEVIKRKGPSMTDPLEIELRPAAALLSPHGRSRRTVWTGVPLEAVEA